MKKMKRILAAAGAILLLLLYASTLVCALSSSENFMNLLMVSIYATVIIPVLLWAYTLIYKLVHLSLIHISFSSGSAHLPPTDA